MGNDFSLFFLCGVCLPRCRRQFYSSGRNQPSTDTRRVEILARDRAYPAPARALRFVPSLRVSLLNAFAGSLLACGDVDVNVCLSVYVLARVILFQCGTAACCLGSGCLLLRAVMPDEGKFP